MDEEGRDAQCADGFACLLIEMLKIIVNKPIGFRVNRHINLRIIQDGDARQNDG